MKTKLVLFLCLTILFVFPTASQDLTPRFSLGMGTPELQSSPFEIVAPSLQAKVGATWRINKWIKNTYEIGYSKFVAGENRSWFSLSPQWELSFHKDSTLQRIVPFIALARTKHFLRWNSGSISSSDSEAPRSNWVQYSFSLGARVALSSRSGIYFKYNRLLANRDYAALSRSNANLEFGFYQELNKISKPSSKEKYPLLTLFSSAGAGEYRTIWQDSIYRTETMYDVHFGLEINKGKRLSYFSSLGIRNGFGLTAGMELSFSVRGSRRFGVRLGLQHKMTKEESVDYPRYEFLYNRGGPYQISRSNRFDTQRSRGIVVDLNYSIRKNITFYMSYFETRFDFNLLRNKVNESLLNYLLSRYSGEEYLLQKIQGLTLGLRVYIIKID
jgi:hypothetical protein